MRPRSSPDKYSDRAENYEGNNDNNIEDAEIGIEGGDRDEIEPLREAVDSLQIVDRDDGHVEGVHGMATGQVPSERRDEGAEASSASSLKPTDGESSNTSSTRQRHSSIQRVEHLHRFSLPPTVTADSAPVVNVLQGPVVRRLVSYADGLARTTLTPLLMFHIVPICFCIVNNIAQVFFSHLSPFSFRSLGPFLKDSRSHQCRVTIWPLFLRAASARLLPAVDSAAFSARVASTANSLQIHFK